MLKGLRLIFGEIWMNSIFRIPRRATGIALYKEFSTFLEQNPTTPQNVELDFGSLSYIEPPCIAFLGNMTRWLINKGSSVTYSNADLQKECIKYLDDSEFFERQLGQKLDAASRCRDTTMPLKNLMHTDSHAWLEFEFIPWLSDKSGLSVASLAEVNSSMKEIINNTKDHTQFDEACVFAQWYPQLAEIKISIADFGCGIRETVTRELPDCTSAEAILWACEDGTSSKSLPSNRGAGLYHLLLNVVLNFNGTVYITSHSGRVRFENRNGKLYSTVIEGSGAGGIGFCVGTSIDMIIDTDNIPHADDEEDFEWQF